MTINRKSTVIAVGAAAGLLALGFGAQQLLARKAPPRPVTAQATLDDIEQTVLATGTLEPVRLVSVGAQVTGQVRRLHVRLGQTVAQGQLIAEIDSAPQQNALRTAQAQLADIRAQRGQIEGALRKAQQSFERQAQMLAVQATAQADYDAAEAELRTARAQLAANTAQITQSAVAVETARLNLGYTRIVAPIAGTVVAIVTEQGQTVNAQQAAPVIVKLGQLDTMTVKAEISEADVIKVRPGLPVYFSVLGDAKRRYSTLRTIEPAPESLETESTTTTASTTSTAIYYNGLFETPNPDGQLRTAMTAQVSIVLGQARRTVTVPAAALGSGGADGVQTLRVLGKDGRVSLRPVRIGLNDGARAQVLSGLKAGEEVVLAQTAAPPMPPPPGGGGMGGGMAPPGGQP